MTAHVFGGISSPPCSNYASKKTAADNVYKYGNETSTIVKRNFYVNDMLKSFPDVKDNTLGFIVKMNNKPAT